MIHLLQFVMIAVGLFRWSHTSILVKVDGAVQHGYKFTITYTTTYSINVQLAQFFLLFLQHTHNQMKHEFRSDSVYILLLCWSLSLAFKVEYFTSNESENTVQRKRSFDRSGWKTQIAIKSMQTGSLNSVTAPANPSSFWKISMNQTAGHSSFISADEQRGNGCRSLRFGLNAPL